VGDRGVLLCHQLVFANLQLYYFEFVSFFLGNEELMFGHEFVFVVLEFYFFLFERIVNLLMFLSQRDQFLFSFPDTLIVEIQS
jgi:hypothetical protein